MILLKFLLKMKSGSKFPDLKKDVSFISYGGINYTVIGENFYEKNWFV